MLFRNCGTFVHEVSDMLFHVVLRDRHRRRHKLIVSPDVADKDIQGIATLGVLITFQRARGTISGINCFD